MHHRAGHAPEKLLSSITGITDLFESVALIPASSGFDHTSAQKDTAHFPRIRDETGVRYDRMLFFDDEHKNVARVRSPGALVSVICMCFVKRMRPFVLRQYIMHSVHLFARRAA